MQPETNLGVVTAVMIGIAVVVGAIFAFPEVFDSFSASILQKLSIPQIIPESQDTQHSGVAEEPQNSDNMVVDRPQEIQYHYERKADSLLNERAFLGSEDIRTYTIQIPLQNVTSLEGTIKVQGNSYVDASFTDSSGAQHCAECSFQVYSIQVVSIPVVPGERMSLVIQSSENTDLQIVDVQLGVTYTVRVEGAGASVSNADMPQLEPSGTITHGSDGSASQTTTKPNISIADLRKYAFDLINEERRKAGLGPVEMSDNVAAQLHAKDVLTTRTISHWTSDGMKPYMRYTIYGGEGSVSQNVALSGRMDTGICESDPSACVTIDPMDAVRRLSTAMVYGDAAADWGHRDNILDEHHTHVSIGIAYDEYMLTLVQNFENNYYDLIQEVSWDNRHIWLSGPYSYDGDGKYQFRGIGIYFDESPTPALYEEHKNESSYGLGRLVALVDEPAPEGYYYRQSDYRIVEASTWVVDADRIDIKFDLLQIIDQHGPGVYTVVLYLENEGDNSGESQFRAIMYSLFEEQITGADVR